MPKLVCTTGDTQRGVSRFAVLAFFMAGGNLDDPFVRAEAVGNQ
jgi:hypothetical protein